jgi:hypothetical protein
MKKCKCGSNRIICVGGKCSDLFSASFGNAVYDGYVLDGIGIGGGDYMEFDYCLECGQIQGEFPVTNPLGLTTATKEEE